MQFSGAVFGASFWVDVLDTIRLCGATFWDDSLDTLNLFHNYFNPANLMIEEALILCWLEKL